MARAQIIANVTGVNPDATRAQYSVAGATVQIYQRGTTTTPSIYAAQSGGSPLTPPFTTDESGRVIDESSDELWVTPQSLDIIATKGLSTYQIAAEAYSAGPGGISKTMADATLLGDYEHAFSTYKFLGRHSMYASPAANGTYLFSTIAGAVLSGANLSGPARFRFDPAMHAAGARSVKLRLITKLSHDNVSPGASRTFSQGLFPVTSDYTGSSTITAGTVVPGSNPTATTIAASTDWTIDSTDFTAPAAGDYALGFVWAGGALSGYLTIEQELWVRQV